MSQSESRQNDDTRPAQKEQSDKPPFDGGQILGGPCELPAMANKLDTAAGLPRGSIEPDAFVFRAESAAGTDSTASRPGESAPTPKVLLEPLSGQNLTPQEKVSFYLGQAMQGTPGASEAVERQMKLLNPVDQIHQIWSLAESGIPVSAEVDSDNRLRSFRIATGADADREFKINGEAAALGPNQSLIKTPSGLRMIETDPSQTGNPIVGIHDSVGFKLSQNPQDRSSWTLSGSKFQGQANDVSISSDGRDLALKLQLTGKQLNQVNGVDYFDETAKVELPMKFQTTETGQAASMEIDGEKIAVAMDTSANFRMSKVSAGDIELKVLQTGATHRLSTPEGTVTTSGERAEQWSFRPNNGGNLRLEKGMLHVTHPTGTSETLALSESERIRVRMSAAEIRTSMDWKNQTLMVGDSELNLNEIRQRRQPAPNMVQR